MTVLRACHACHPAACLSFVVVCDMCWLCPACTSGAHSKSLLTTLEPLERDVRTVAFVGAGLLSCPPALLRFGHLTSLSLAHNRLPVLVEGFDALQSLQELRLDNNLFESVPTEVLCLRNLTSLSMSHCRLAALPPTAPRTCKLKELVVDHNMVGTSGRGWGGVDGRGPPFLVLQLETH